MTTNIFDQVANEKLLKRLSTVRPETQPIWGKMNCSQMVKHCQKPLEVATGQLNLKQNLIGILFGKMAKRNFLKADEFKKNLPTAPSFLITETPDFDTEVTYLKELITRFGTEGAAIIKNKKHPFFGVMNDEEWGILQYKHLDHHLKQFGV